MNILDKISIRIEHDKRVSEHTAFYKMITGKEIDLDNPRDLNEKIQWLIVNHRGRREAKLTDKVLVKDYVKKKQIKGLYIPKTLKTYHSVDEIDIDELPDKFVLKCNHFSGGVFICNDKKTFDLEAAKRVLAEDLTKDFSEINKEYHYRYIKPLIMAEEYLDDKKHKNPIDYKFYCFDGEPDCVHVCSDREDGVRFSDFDLNWKSLDYVEDERKSKEKLKKPANLDKMVEIARQLAQGMLFVRVDLYEVNGKIYFGEYTFTPGAGIIKYYKQEALDYLGSKIDLGKVS